MHHRAEVPVKKTFDGVIRLFIYLCWVGHVAHRGEMKNVYKI
jgi:hypothetical protein